MEITEEMMKNIVEHAHMRGQHDANGCNASYSQASTYYNKEVKKLIISDTLPRYFVDCRVGCAAVRDRKHSSYDSTYQGLHCDTADVIEYKHGSFKDGEWKLDSNELNSLYMLCNDLNKAEQHIEQKMFTESEICELKQSEYERGIEDGKEIAEHGTTCWQE